AEGLKGALLICHGMVDTNVFFQDSVRLVQRLIELRKENWSIAPYPVEDHGFQIPSSWADEYKRIFALFEKNLKKWVGQPSLAASRPPGRLSLGVRKQRKPARTPACRRGRPPHAYSRACTCICGLNSS